MISLIGRGEHTTDVLLEELVDMERHIGNLAVRGARARRRSGVAPWPASCSGRDTPSSYVQRNAMSPNSFASPIQIVEILVPPKDRCGLRKGLARAGHPPAGVGARQRHRTHAGRRPASARHRSDCLAMVLDRPRATTTLARAHPLRRRDRDGATSSLEMNSMTACDTPPASIALSAMKTCPGQALADLLIDLRQGRWRRQSASCSRWPAKHALAFWRKVANGVARALSIFASVDERERV